MSASLSPGLRRVAGERPLRLVPAPPDPAGALLRLAGAVRAMDGDDVGRLCAAWAAHGSQGLLAACQAMEAEDSDGRWCELVAPVLGLLEERCPHGARCAVMCAAVARAYPDRLRDGQARGLLGAWQAATLTA